MIEEDFVSWLQDAMSASRPIERLQTLGAYQENPQVLKQALQCLKALIEIQEQNQEESYGLVFMMSAAAFLKLTSGGPTLYHLCELAFEKCQKNE